jgi:uncharacterized protein YcbK (DUF882 family)
VLLPSVIALLLSLADGGVAPRSAPASKPAPAPTPKSFTLKRPAPAAAKAPAPAKPAAAGSKPASAKKKTPGKQKKPPRPKVIELFHVNSKETLRLRFVDDRGKPIKGVQKRADHFFRCHHTRATSRMHPRLLRLLFDVGRHWPGQRIEVISGYRNPKVAKNPRSPHMKGLACDFRVVGVANTDLRDYLRRAYKSVGVGYYPNSTFVHLDVRRGASAFWIDYSGPGESAMYSENAAEDLRSGRAESWKPTKIDPSWAEYDELPSNVPDGGVAGGQAPAAPRQDGSVQSAPQVQ